jgi:glycosyltransferase involved in cell wall biosynthesis
MGHEVHVIVGPPYPQIPEGVVAHKVENLNFYDTGAKAALRQNPSRVLTPLNLWELAATRLWMFPEMFAFSIRAYFKVRELLPRHRFNIIHDNQTLAYGILLMKTFGIPVVATIHHPLPIDKKADIAQARNFRERLGRVMFYPFFMQHLVSRRMDRVITVSRSSAMETRDAFGVREDKLRVVYNGIDTDVFRKTEEGEKEPYSLITVANTRDRKKGVFYLLQAVRLLKEELPIKLTIVDDPDPEEGFAPYLVRKYGLGDVVSFTGRLTTTELVKQYCRAEIAVTASTYEGFGLPAAEAMACSTPVVATTAGALPEVVEDGVSGVLVPPANPQALASAIKRLLEDEALRGRMGEAGRKRVERHFSWQEAARRTLAVYEEVTHCSP